MSDDYHVPDAVTAPVLALDADGVVRGANAAFVSASAGALDKVVGRPFSELCDARAPGAQNALRALGDALRSRAPLDGVALVMRDGNGAPWPVSLSARAAGRAIWLTLLDRRAALHTERLEELLSMAQQFGRLGVFERDPRTLAGQWDRHMHRFWGLSVVDRAPDFHEAQNYVVPEDRAGMGQKFLDSTKTAGNYSHHFRVRGADGVLRRLHSQWTVRNGPDGVPDRVLGVIVDDTEIWRHAATYVDKLLKGARAAELPVEQPTKFKLVISMKAARLLGLRMPSRSCFVPMKYSSRGGLHLCRERLLVDGSTRATRLR